MGAIKEYLGAARSEWTPGSVDPLEGLLLYALVRNLKPRRLVEIGRSAGYSTLWIAAACEDNDLGIIVSIDPVSEQHCEDVFDKRIRESGAHRYIRKITSGSVEAVQRCIWDVAGFHGFYDFLFLDGDHSRQAVCDDLGHWLPHMAPHGMLVMHDTVFFEDEIAHRVRSHKSEYFDRAWPGEVIRTLVERSDITDFDALTLDTGHGMTLIRRKSSL